MEMHLKEHSDVSPSLTLSKPPKFLIAGDQGPLHLSIVCCEGASQTYRRTVQHLCRAILAALHTRKFHRDKGLKEWFLWACLHGVPISVCWIAGCTQGIPEMGEREWSEADHRSVAQMPGEVSQQASCLSKATSEPLWTEQHVQCSHFSEVNSDDPLQVTPGVMPVREPSMMNAGDFDQKPSSLEVSTNEINCVPKGSLQGALLLFGMPKVEDQVCKQPVRVDAVACTHIAESVQIKQMSKPELAACQVGRQLSSQAEPGQGKSDNQSRQFKGAQLVGCGDALVPYMYTAVASLQNCFAYLCGTRVGEASHPGPGTGQAGEARQVKHDSSTGVRIGEAKNPGPSPFGPELENMIKQYVMEAVREAIKEAFQNLGLSATAASMQTPEIPQGGQQSGSTSTDKHGKGSPKGQNKPQAPPPSDKDQGKGKDGTAAKPLAKRNHDNPPSTSTALAKRGKGRGQAAENEWKLVTRQPKTGEFQLRSQDWNAPIVPFNKLSAAIDATEANAVLEGVILADKQEIEHAKIMLQGSKARYKFLLIFLAKEDKSQKIPGRIQDQLCFRDAIVQQCHSSDVSQSPTPAGLASAPIKVAPLQSIAVYVRVPKQFASDQLWSSFCKNASKTAATWAADRHVQPLDSFNWAEEKQRTGGQELQVFGIMRVPKKDMSTLLSVSGQQGVFIEPCRSQAPRIKISWIERVKGETATQYLTRANQHGAAFGLAVHGGCLGWRLAAQPDELLPRVWNLPWLPMHWDDDAVRQLLASEFKEIELLTHRRNRGNLSYRFRATCLKGDKDLVALLAETDTGPLTLWASVAPARTLQKSQRKLPQGAVPVVAPKQRSTAFPTASKALTEPEVGADGKPVPGAKRTKCDVRTVPDELRTISIAKDGNCVYRAVSEGLAWLSGGKLTVEHREVRAKAITHLQKHKTAYSAQWDGESPSGEPMQSFDDYLAASARDSAYGSPLEVEALARVFDVQIILIPCIADFAVMSFRTSQAKRVLVLWCQDKHIDLLIPKADVKKYPEAVLSITTGPVHKLRAGGPRSTSSHVSKTASRWTIGARSSASLASPKPGCQGKDGDKMENLETSSLWSNPRAPSDVSFTKNGADARSECQESVCIASCNKSDATLAKPNVRTPASRQTFARALGSQRQGRGVCSSRSNRVGEALPSSLPSAARRSQHSSQTKKHVASAIESDAESQDLSGCQPEKPRKHFKPAVQASTQAKQASFVAACPHCPYKVAWQTQAQCRSCLRYHCKKHHPEKPQPKPLPRRKGKRATYEDLVRVPVEGEQLYWQCSLCNMAIHQDDAEKLCESSLAKHKAQHKRKHHPRLSWKKWRALDYEDRASKVVRTKLHARTSNAFGDIKEMQQLGISFLWWPRRRGHCKLVKHQSNFIARMRPAWVCDRCGTTSLEKKAAIKHAKSSCPLKVKSCTFSLARCRFLLKHRINTLTKLREDFCKLAPPSKRRTADLLLFDKAIECFGGFQF